MTVFKVLSRPEFVDALSNFLRKISSVNISHSSPSVQTPALRSVGNIVTGDDNQTQVVISAGILTALLALLSSQKEGIRKEACWTISNITAGNSGQIQGVIDANLIPPLISILSRGEFKTKKEACWALSNATSNAMQRPEHIRYLVHQGCVKPMCDLLGSGDNKIIQVSLDGLENILKVGELDKPLTNYSNQMALFIEEAGGMEKIHELQLHDNADIYKKAYHIIDCYFGDDGEEETGAGAPGVDDSGKFGFNQMENPQGGFNFGQ